MSKIRTYESNSQPHQCIPERHLCCSWCQRYELMRAIHNYYVVDCFFIELFLMSKIRTYESNSQRTMAYRRTHPSCSWCQRYELMRAIHNPKGSMAQRIMVVPDVKDTNLWEQFTTKLCRPLWRNSLFLMSKIRTYESNSQHYRLREYRWSGCSWCQRYELMRAIHNMFIRVALPYRVVPDVKDTNLWEQFTTNIYDTSSSRPLFLMSKIRTYESNSQPGRVFGEIIISCSWCQRYELMRAIHN